MTTNAKQNQKSSMRTDAQIARENYQRYLYALRQRHDEFIKKADKCEAFFGSDQWTPEDKARLDREKRPYLTINKIKPIVRVIPEARTWRPCLTCSSVPAASSVLFDDSTPCFLYHQARRQ